MAFTLSELAIPKTTSPSPSTSTTPTPRAIESDFYDPRGFTTRRRTSSSASRPSPPHTASVSRITIPGTKSNAAATSLLESPTTSTGSGRLPKSRLSRPPALSMSPDNAEGSSGSEATTPSQIEERDLVVPLTASTSSRLQAPETTLPFPLSPKSPPSPGRGIPLPRLRTFDEPDVVVRSTTRYTEADLGRSMPAAFRRRDDSPPSSTSGSRPPSGAAWSPAAAYLSSFSRGPSMHALSEGEPEVVEEVNGYALSKVIGYGGTSTVRQGKHIETGEIVAVKLVRTDVSSTPNTRQRTHSTPASSQHSRSSSLSSIPTVLSLASEDAGATIDREVRIWSGLAAHPHILPLLDVYAAPDILYIFMPFCAGGNLLQYIQEYARRGRRRQQSPADSARGEGGLQRSRTASIRRILSPTEEVAMDPMGGVTSGFDLGHARHIFMQVVDGIKYLHLEAEVTHKDIKLENVLLDDLGRFRIADFGLAVSHAADSRATSEPISMHLRVRSEPADIDHMAASWSPDLNSATPTGPGLFGMVAVAAPTIGSPAPPFTLNPPHSLAPGSQQPAGSLAYCAPESLSSHPAETSPAVDIWALGCVLFALLDGRLPFVDDYEPRLRVKILDGRWDTPRILSRSNGGPAPFSASAAFIRRPPSRDRMSISSKDSTYEDQQAACEAVLRGCLEPDPMRRWTIEQVKSSRWLSEHWPTNLDSEDSRSRSRSRDRRALSFCMTEEDESSRRGRVQGRRGSEDRRSRSRSQGPERRSRSRSASRGRRVV